MYLHDFGSLEQAQQVIGNFVRRYNEQSILERHAYQTPTQVRQALKIVASSVHAVLILGAIVFCFIELALRSSGRTKGGSMVILAILALLLVILLLRYPAESPARQVQPTDSVRLLRL